MALDDVVVVSNRGPLSFRLDAGGRLTRGGTGGGLAGTVHPLVSGSGATWVSAAMSEADRRAADEGLMATEGLRLVTLQPDERVYAMAYNVVANATLWYAHHHLWDLPRRPRLDRRWAQAWDAYRAYNRQFAGTVAAAAPPGARVLVQDYHLTLVGSMLAAERPDLRTVHFSHTPFADPAILRTLPDRAAGELLAGMAGFGACGFHTARWEAAFRAAYDDPVLSGAAGGVPAPATIVAGLGPHPGLLAEEAGGGPVEEAVAVLRRRVAGRRLVVRVDRVELSKNILRGLWAFDELLETRPAWRGRVTMLALAYPSREGLADYLAYRSEVEHAVAQLNARWAGGDWEPVILDVADDRARSVAALRLYDVLLVNPVRDGMNLVAKEGPLVNETDGVLVLSREAGAYEELGGAAVGVNPFDVSGTTVALEAALAMDAGRRAEMARGLRSRIAANPASRWLERQLEAADAVAPGPLTG